MNADWMPEPPEGMYWHLKWKDSDYGTAYVYLSLREKRKHLLWTEEVTVEEKLASNGTGYTSREDLKIAIKDTGQSILREYSAKLFLSNLQKEVNN